MAARGGSGLTDEQVDQLREQLAAGRRPKVRVSGAQFADGASGVVLAVGDPQADGADFITVRVKAGGVTDELRFAPRELTAGTARGQAAAQPAAATASTKRAPKGRRAGQSAAAQPARPNKTTRKATPRAGSGAPATPSPPATPTPTPQTAAAGAKPGRRRAAQLPTVSLTFMSSGATWSVSARRGSRTVTKSAPVSPGVVSAVAQLLELPSVSEAVADVNDAALRVAEARAAALRAELAAVEAEVESHQHP